jgi:spoIIIJ-associated protein
MQTIEITGKSLQEAKEAAAKQLGASADALEVTVLEETKGLFGKSNVRIRAAVKGNGQAPTEAVVTEPPQAPKQESSAPAAEPAAAEKREPRGRGRGRAAKPTEQAEEPAAAEAAAPEATEAPAARADQQAQPDATEEDGERILALVREILKVGDLDVSAEQTGISGRYVNIELDGRDAAFLVGKHGEVLNALQYLVNIISNQRNGNGVRATLDGNNYRNRREEALTQMATKIAEQVQKRGEEAVLDALPAFERRIVHKALSEYPGVATYSEGEEPNRRVVIAPSE